jgi:hypothetical protein
MKLVPAPSPVLSDIESNQDPLMDMRDELQEHFWCDFSDLFPHLKWDDLTR